MCVAASIGRIGTVTSYATGLYNIPLLFIKLLLPLILLVLTQLFNVIVTSSIFLLYQKFPKSPQFQKLISLRKNLTITLFPSFLSSQRLLETICLRRWPSTLPVIILLCHFSLYSTWLQHNDDIHSNLELNEPKIFVLLDFPQAFDIVCHGLFNVHSSTASKIWIS
jgi:hypothetical protein